MALTRIKTNQITDLAVTNAKIANTTIAGGKLANNLTYGSDLTVSGNLTVSGTTTSVSTTNTRVDDAILALASGTSGSPSEDAGLLINRGSDDNQAFLWDETADEFVVANVGSEDGDTSGNVTISSYAGLHAGAVVYGSLNDGTTTLTSTVAELNLIDGSTAGTVVNSKAVIYGSSGEVNATSLEVGGAAITSTPAELNLNDGATAGTVVNSKTVVYGSGGEVNATELQIGGVAITATAAEINALDGINATVTELNIMDGDTSVGTTAVAGGDGIVTNDNGTMQQTSVDTFDTYLAATTKTLTNKTINSDSNTLTLDLSEGTLTGTTAEFNAALSDDSFATLTNTVTLTNKTLTAPIVDQIEDSNGNELVIFTTTTSAVNEITLANAAASGHPTITTTGSDTNINLVLSPKGSGTIDVDTSKIVNVTDPTSNQDAATKAYVDSQVTSGSTLAIAGDSGTDNVIVGSNTFTFSGTANEIVTAVTDNTVTISLPDDVTIGGDAVVTGNLTVNGTTTTISTTNSVVSDNLIELNNGAGSNANDSGIVIERGSTGDNAIFVWDESADKFTMGTTTATGSSTGDLTITAGTLVVATLEGDVTGDVTGNADTATALATARAIQISGDVTGTANFDGSAAINIAATIAANSVALGTDTTGNYVATIADAGNSAITVANSGAESAAVTLDIADNAVALGTKTTGNYVATITGGNGITSSGATSGETIDHSLSVDLTDTAIFASDGTVSRAVVLDGSGDFTANAITTTNIDGIIGANTAAAGSFTTVGTTGEATLASAIVSDLTSTRIVFAGTSGALEDSANLVFASNSLDVTGAITATGNIDIADAGSLRVGTGNDFTINHDATDTTITNGTGILAIDGAATSSIRINEAGANVDTVIEGDSNASLFVVDASQDNVGIGGAPNANAILDLNDTGAMLLARGTTAQRPGTAVTGMFRYNTTTNQIEYYDNDSWESVSTAFTLASSQTFNGDDTTTAFTLSSLSGSDSYTVAGVLVMLNGVVQEPTTVYGISGTTLTFTTAPATGDLIEVRKFTTTTTVTSLSDADGDTLVQVEEGSDDDTIRFDAAGNEIATIGAAGQTINNELALRFAEASGNGSNYIALKAPATVSSNVTFTLPAADGTSGQAMVTDASGNLSFAAAGATISSDTSTNTDFLLYFASTTSGALTAVKQDSGLTYNPSTETLTTSVFAGEATSAQYADLAEMYAADADIEPGTVVHFAGEGKLAECDTANCRAVAGIVSTDPAHLMNSGQEGVALALAGRVPCKVTGAVAAGDLMVSAGNGMAMANNEAAMGTVIGKAIEANEGGEGVIEVLALMM